MIPVMRLLRLLTARQDLALVALLLMTVFMIILPLPTWLIDALIGMNLGLVVLILIVTVYLRNPTSFSTLPSILLFSTLFRLAISISTTRMILVQADAGRIVETFGDFVVAGSLVVGLVVFLIITVVQFVVITKGSERVAEVSARFSLDALPGRQMSIDSDMRSGEIDMAQAKERRAALQLESEFYGSMDGAMKFVKGDAIAGLIIIAVNLIGGITVGVVQNGMSGGEAMTRYSILTVGDGLVSQIPALLMAISSGIVITRISHEKSGDLGQDIAEQMGDSPRALQIAAGVLLLFALIPGFPWAVFGTLAAFFFVCGLVGARRARRAVAEGLAAGAPTDPRQDLAMAPMSPVHLALGRDLAPSIDRAAFREHALIERTRLFDQLGVPFPPVVLAASEGPPDRWQLIVENVPVAEGAFPIGRLRLADDPELAEMLGVPTEAHEVAGAAGHWAETRHAAEFLGVHETGALLASMEPRYDELVKEAQKALPVQKIALILRRLVEEQVPVRNVRIVLETIAEWAGREKDPDILAEYVRAALARQISHRYADPDRFIPAYVMDADVEEMIRGAVRHSSVGSFLALEPDQSRRLLASVRDTLGDLAAHASTPVLMSTMDIRRFVHRFLREQGIECPVLSHKEVAGNYKVQPLAMVTM
jgi:type III secretion protein V